MENLASKPGQAPQSAIPQRHVRLRRATIRTDDSGLHRTAEFTDGSTRAVRMQWNGVRRVAAFRRDVLTRPVLCVAVTDPANVVVLDESMEGWESLLAALSTHLTEARTFAQWRSNIAGDSADSHWTALFTATQAPQSP